MTGRLAEIEARVNAATEGPWQSVGRHDVDHTNWVSVASGTLAMAAADYDADAEFIAHARSDVPFLLARVRELEAALREAIVVAEASGLTSATYWLRDAKAALAAAVPAKEGGR